ncbi:hypothetical protein R6Q59_028410 [Mikania micrantha]
MAFKWQHTTPYLPSAKVDSLPPPPSTISCRHPPPPAVGDFRDLISHT